MCKNVIFNKVTGLQAASLSKSRLKQVVPCEFCEFCLPRYFISNKTMVEMFNFEFCDFFEVPSSLQIELQHGYFLMNFSNLFSLHLYQKQEFDTGAFL